MRIAGSSEVTIVMRDRKKERRTYDFFEISGISKTSGYQSLAAALV